MKKHRFYHILAFVAVLFALVACKSNQVQLEDLVRKINKNQPQDIDGEVRLDSLSAMPNLTIAYHFTGTNITHDGFTPEEIEVIGDDTKSEILKTLENGPKELRRLMNAGVTFHYFYRDLNGVLVLDFTITPEEYKK